MTTHAPTPADYAALRMRLDRFTGYREVAMHWPHVSIDAGPAALDGISVTEGGRSDAEAIVARAAWWTALVSPRREAEADEAADAELARATVEGRICGWCKFTYFETLWVPDGHPAWNMPGSDERQQLVERDGLTHRELRARLAFAEATGAECGTCCGSGRWQPMMGNEHDCDVCRGTGRVLPEPVPQRDASHGARCGCARVSPSREPESLAFGAVYASPSCEFCDGTGFVRDGRRDGQHDYDPGDRPPHWLYAPGADAATPAQRELAHRREQPDACGHPAMLDGQPFERFGEKGRRVLARVLGAFLTVAPGRLPARQALNNVADRCRDGLARAPLAETLHGEWDEPPDTSGHAGQAMGYVASGASRREGP